MFLANLSYNPPQTNCSICLSLLTFAFHPSWPVMVCAFLLHQHHKRSGVRRGERGGEGKGQPPSPCTHTPNLLQLHLLHLPTANGQTHAPVNSNIASTTHTPPYPELRQHSKSFGPLFQSVVFGIGSVVFGIIFFNLPSNLPADLYGKDRKQ